MFFFSRNLEYEFLDHWDTDQADSSQRRRCGGVFKYTVNFMLLRNSSFSSHPQLVSGQLLNCKTFSVAITFSPGEPLATVLMYKATRARGSSGIVVTPPVLLSSSRETQHCSVSERVFPCEHPDVVSYWSPRYLPLCSGVSFS